MSQKHEHDRIVSLQLTARMPFLPVATHCVETAAKAFGLGRDESLKLSLATEEIFSYLSSNVCRGESVDIRCVNGLSYVRVEFRFSVSALDMGALNIAASVTCDNDDDMPEMGLAIASRTIDRLNIMAERQNRVCLAIEKDKDYPSVPETPLPPAVVKGLLTAETPDTEGVKIYVTRVNQGPPDPLRPPFFQYPGKVADMVAAGDCQIVTAVDARGECAGGVLFRFRTARIVEVFGPHVFCPAREGEIADMLLTACIARIARTKAIGIVNLTGMPLSVRGQYELLGSLKYSGDDGKSFVRSWYYRLLHEDPGYLVFTDAILKEYLEGEFKRLFLAREIRDVHDQGEIKEVASIFSTEMLREGSTAVLSPLWPGADLDDNVKRHLRFLKDEAINNIFFNLDLGIYWHASLMRVLIDNNCRPALIIPFGAQADMLIFQYDRTEP
ncbi:MAG TPA: hypothetical protein DCG53_00280 [Syntrophus sp. (in: bacteria)]|nr:hypothetical protein [Syntrophus sp. (in: bacteria)]